MAGRGRLPGHRGSGVPANLLKPETYQQRFSPHSFLCRNSLFSQLTPVQNSQLRIPLRFLLPQWLKFFCFLCVLRASAVKILRALFSPNIFMLGASSQLISSYASPLKSLAHSDFFWISSFEFRHFLPCPFFCHIIFQLQDALHLSKSFLGCESLVR